MDRKTVAKKDAGVVLTLTDEKLSHVRRVVADALDDIEFAKGLIDHGFTGPAVDEWHRRFEARERAIAAAEADAQAPLEDQVGMEQLVWPATKDLVQASLAVAEAARRDKAKRAPQA